MILLTKDYSPKGELTYYKQIYPDRDHLTDFLYSYRGFHIEWDGWFEVRTDGNYWSYSDYSPNQLEFDVEGKMYGRWLGFEDGPLLKDLKVFVHSSIPGTSAIYEKGANFDVTPRPGQLIPITKHLSKATLEFLKDDALIKMLEVIDKYYDGR